MTAYQAAVSDLPATKAPIQQHVNWYSLTEIFRGYFEMLMPFANATSDAHHQKLKQFPTQADSDKAL
jgi:hypothetical protein